MEYDELFSRSELLLGREAMQRLAAKKVILFGVGGVGSWCAEGLIRSGVMHLTMVDPDRVAVSNINRQLPATTQTVGQLKVEVLKRRLEEINPLATIVAIPELYSEGTSESFHLEQYDYIVDAIDFLAHKQHLLVASSKTGATIFSSMGAALKMDPLNIRVAEFWEVKGCKLAQALRTRMRKSGEKPLKPILCVYSEERLPNRGERIEVGVGLGAGAKTWLGAEAEAEAGALELPAENVSTNKTRVNGSMVQVTATFGFTLSGLVIQDIAEQTSKQV
ncbi:MAG TPA: tRNA threonylcarbamoyladenosine dehydratase [Petrimonas sp.]|jgi:tRNA A37 threonylcarbamoyladenosine dehydratase|nr:tRNA threonylcarbamoyladenosine dehydratase [Petrimonas sp.]